MTNYTRIAALALLCILCAPTLFVSGGYAGETKASPEGEWLVRDKTAHIRIAGCGGRLWGVISWADKPGTDKNNPDSALRSRPILGMPVLLGMTQAGEKWQGDIYNAENGKVYRSSIRLPSADVLHVEGCLWNGFLCGGEDWTRIDGEAGRESTDSVCRRIPASL